MEALAIRKENIDWMKIINLVLNKKDWGKTYIMYSYGSTTISCMMKEFNFEDQTAWFRIKVEFVYNDTKQTETDLVMYALKNFSADDFKMHLNKRLISILTNITSSKTRSKGKGTYSHMRYSSVYNEDIIKHGFENDLKSIEGMEDEDLRNTCMESLEDKVLDILNEDYEDAVDNYCRENSNKVKIVGFDSIVEEIKKEED